MSEIILCIQFRCLFYCPSRRIVKVYSGETLGKANWMQGGMFEYSPDDRRTRPGLARIFSGDHLRLNGFRIRSTGGARVEFFSQTAIVGPASLEAFSE